VSSAEVTYHATLARVRFDAREHEFAAAAGEHDVSRFEEIAVFPFIISAIRSLGAGKLLLLMGDQTPPSVVKA
jgi:hypothetical protein